MSGGGTNKPFLNALYYIKHVAGNKYVHAKDGGKDVPTPGTGLVFHDVREGTELKFFLTNYNGRTYLKHDGSKRFCCPYNRGYNNNATIHIVESLPEIDDSFEVVEHEGMAFLRGTGSNHYVHPRGGANQPGNGTELVLYEGWRPALALTFIPAEDYEIINTEFDLSSMNNTPGQIITSTYSTQANYGSQPLNYTFRTNYQQSITNSVEFTLSTELGVSISSTVTAGIKLVEASVTVEYSFKIGTSYTKATSTTQGLENEHTLTYPIPPGKTVKATTTQGLENEHTLTYPIPPGKTVKATSTTQGLENEHTLTYPIPPGKTVKVYSQTERKNGQRIPFRTTVRSKRGQEFVLTGVANVDVFFNQKGYLYEYDNGQVPTSPPREVNM